MRVRVRVRVRVKVRVRVRVGRLVEHRDAEQGRVVAPRDLAWVRG